MLLRVLGENPAGYPSFSDKASILLVYLLDYSIWFLPILFLIIPFVWLLINNIRGMKITKKIFIIVIVVSIVASVVGYLVPVIITNLMMGLGVQSFYGGQI